MAWDCCHRRKNEFPSLSRHFAAKLTTKPKLNRGLVMQRDKNPKHRRKSTTEWPQQEKKRLLERPSQEFWHQLCWDAVSWPQETDSHQASQEYYWPEPFLYRGMVQNASGPLCRFHLQLQETFNWGYCCQRRVQVIPKGSHTFFLASVYDLLETSEKCKYRCGIILHLWVL